MKAEDRKENYPKKRENKTVHLPENSKRRKESLPSRRFFRSVLFTGLLLALIISFAGLCVRADNAVIATDESAASSTTSSADLPTPPKISADTAILYEPESGAVLYEKNAYTQTDIGGMVKLMTAIVAADNLDMNSSITFTDEALYNVPYGTSALGFISGETITVQQALYALIMSSAGDAGMQLAYSVSGDEQDFVQKMNEEAAILGCTNTNFTNCLGNYDENQYSTAFDLAKISAAFFSNDDLCTVSNTGSYEFTQTDSFSDSFWINSDHALVNGDLSFDGIIGGRTSYTEQSGDCVVTGCRQSGITLICILLNADEENEYYETEELFEYGYGNFNQIKLKTTDTSNENQTGSDSEESHVDTGSDYFNLYDQPFMFEGKDLLGNSQTPYVLPETVTLMLPENANLNLLDWSFTYDETSEEPSSLVTFLYSGMTVGQTAVTSVASTEPSVHTGDSSTASAAVPSSGSESGSDSSSAPASEGFFSGIITRDNNHTIFIKLLNLLTLIAIIAAIICLLLTLRHFIHYQNTLARRRKRKIQLNRKIYQKQEEEKKMKEERRPRQKLQKPHENNKRR